MIDKVNGHDYGEQVTLTGRRNSKILWPLVRLQAFGKTYKPIRGNCATCAFKPGCYLKVPCCGVGKAWKEITK